MPEREATRLQLPPAYFEILKDVLRKSHIEGDVWAFGSRVSGTGHAASDLDLVIRNPSDLNAETKGLGHFIENLMESNLPIHVDVLDWARIPESFREEILKEYVVLR